MKTDLRLGRRGKWQKFACITVNPTVAFEESFCSTCFDSDWNEHNSSPFFLRLWSHVKFWRIIATLKSPFHVKSAALQKSKASGPRSSSLPQNQNKHIRRGTKRIAMLTFRELCMRNYQINLISWPLSPPPPPLCGSGGAKRPEASLWLVLTCVRRVFLCALFTFFGLYDAGTSLSFNQTSSS